MLKYQWTDGSSPSRSVRSQKEQYESQGVSGAPQHPGNGGSDIGPGPGSGSSTQSTPQFADPCMISSPNTTMMSDPTYFRNMDSPIDQHREDTHFRIAERDMMSQIGQNPFFSYGTDVPASYADQVSLQDKFLKPMSTVHTDKAKPSLATATVNPVSAEL